MRYTIKAIADRGVSRPDSQFKIYPLAEYTFRPLDGGALIKVLLPKADNWVVGDTINKCVDIKDEKKITWAPPQTYPVEDTIFERFQKDFMELSEKDEISIKISPKNAWSIFVQLQVALRHPDNDNETAQIAKGFAVCLEKRIALTPALKEMARRGWMKVKESKPIPKTP